MAQPTPTNKLKMRTKLLPLMTLTVGKPAAITMILVHNK